MKLTRHNSSASTGSTTCVETDHSPAGSKLTAAAFMNAAAELGMAGDGLWGALSAFTTIRLYGADVKL